MAATWRSVHLASNAAVSAGRGKLPVVTRVDMPARDGLGPALMASRAHTGAAARSQRGFSRHC